MIIFSEKSLKIIKFHGIEKHYFGVGLRAIRPTLGRAGPAPPRQEEQEEGAHRAGAGGQSRLIHKPP